MKKILRTIIKAARHYRNNFGKIHLVYVPLVVCASIGALLILYSFLNREKDTTALTNVSFAMFVTLSSVCFGYARVFDQPKELKLVVKITKAGESALQAAIYFVIASALKYVNLKMSVFIPKGTFFNITYVIIYVSYFFCFILGFYFAVFAVFSINNILNNRFYRNDNEEDLKQNNAINK